MGGIFAKVLIGVGMKLVTERFAATLIVEGLRAVANATDNTYDDRIVKQAEKILGVEPESSKK